MNFWEIAQDHRKNTKNSRTLERELERIWEKRERDALGKILKLTRLNTLNQTRRESNGYKMDMCQKSGTEIRRLRIERQKSQSQQSKRVQILLTNRPTQKSLHGPIRNFPRILFQTLRRSRKVYSRDTCSLRRLLPTLRMGLGHRSGPGLRSGLGYLNYGSKLVNQQEWAYTTNLQGPKTKTQKKTNRPRPNTNKYEQ